MYKLFKGERPMYVRLLILLSIVITCSGCITLVKEQQPQNDVCSVPSDKKPDMVWVEAKTNKIWVNPHLDDNGDMVEGHYKYTVITPGHWAVVKEKQHE